MEQALGHPMTGGWGGKGLSRKEWINTVPRGWLSEITTGELGRQWEGTEQKATRQSEGGWRGNLQGPLGQGGGDLVHWHRR